MKLEKKSFTDNEFWLIRYDGKVIIKNKSPRSAEKTAKSLNKLSKQN